MGFFNKGSGGGADRPFIDDGVYRVRFLGAGEPQTFDNKVTGKDGKVTEKKVESSAFNFEIVSGGEGEYNGLEISKWVNVNASINAPRPGGQESTLRQVTNALVAPLTVEDLPDFADMVEYLTYMINRECKIIVSVKTKEDGTQQSTIAEFKPLKATATAAPVVAAKPMPTPQPRAVPGVQAARPMAATGASKSNTAVAELDTEDVPF